MGDVEARRVLRHRGPVTVATAANVVIAATVGLTEATITGTAIVTTAVDTVVAREVASRAPAFRPGNNSLLRRRRLAREERRALAVWAQAMEAVTEAVLIRRMARRGWAVVVRRAFRLRRRVALPALHPAFQAVLTR